MLKVRTILFFLSLIIKFSLIGAIIISAITKQWLPLFISSLTLLLTFFPALLKRNYKVTLPLEFEFLIVFFIYGTLYLGELGDFYYKYYWWDTMLHTLSAMILAILGFLLVEFLNKDKQTNLHLSPLFVSIFSFCFAFSIGALWEIFEFTMDQIFNTDMLKLKSRGIYDTFKDLIVDALGALIVSFGGYFYAKKNRVSIVEKLVKLLIKKSANN